jgi:ech hydrogenase subunit D
MENQPITAISREQLVATAQDLKTRGYRLVHICATLLPDGFEVTYAFDKDYCLVNYRIVLTKADAVMPSISGTYLASFTYENELQDLFGIKITDLALNFNGNFYRTTVKTPFAIPKPETKAQ